MEQLVEARACPGHREGDGAGENYGDLGVCSTWNKCANQGIAHVLVHEVPGKGDAGDGSDECCYFCRHGGPDDYGSDEQRGVNREPYAAEFGIYGQHHSARARMSAQRSGRLALFL